MKKLIKNVSVFDGHTWRLKEKCKIIISGNLVEEILQGEVSEEGFDLVLDAGNRVAMPGLVDCHVHLSNNSGKGAIRVDERAVRSVRVAREMLLRGFTSVRDAGGITYGLKKSIDEGFLEGPRIFPSNAHISQTSGNGDLREGPGCWINNGSLEPQPPGGVNRVVNGVPQMLQAVREQFLLGASQIKLMVGGRLASETSPLQTVQFTYEEMKAAVDAAGDYGTYVMAHAYTPEAIRRGIRAGIQCFEHVTLMDEEAARELQEAGCWVMPGPQAEHELENWRAASTRALNREALLREGHKRAAELIVKYHLPILFGTDLVGDPQRLEKYQLTDLGRYADQFGNREALLAATGNAYELSKLTTCQNPYPEGKIGVLEKGSFADLLIVDGDPLEDIRVLENKEKIRLIMKDAVIYKNTL